jgi:uncharacterized membrane protein YwaF
MCFQKVARVGGRHGVSNVRRSVAVVVVLNVLAYLCDAKLGD